MINDIARRAAFLCAAAGCAAMLLSCVQRETATAFGGKIVAVAGSAEIFRMGSDSWREATAGAAIDFGDSVMTGGESKVEIRFGANTVIIDESTLVAVNSFADSSGARGIEFFNCAGAVLANIEKLAGGHESFSVRTPTAVASIRGTHFYVAFEAEARLSHIDVFRGKVWVVNPLLPFAAPVIVLPGFFTEVRPFFAPVMPVAIPYGQWKKMARVMPQPIYLRYHKKLKFYRLGPPGIAPKFPRPRRGGVAPAKLRTQMGPKDGPALRGRAAKQIAPPGLRPAGQRLGPSRRGPLAPVAPLAPRAVRPSAAPLRPAIAPIDPHGKGKTAKEDAQKAKKGKKKR